MSLVFGKLHHTPHANMKVLANNMKMILVCRHTERILAVPMMEPSGIPIFKEWMDYQKISGDGGNWKNYCHNDGYKTANRPI